jgi:hypothetical protein
MGIPVGDLSPRGTGMGKKCSSQAFVGIPTGKFFRRGDGDVELFSDGNSSLPSLDKTSNSGRCVLISCDLPVEGPINNGFH